MRLSVKSLTGTLASANIVLPVSDEMDCSACHASGTGPAAQPMTGWVNDPDPQRDFRLNILRLHDDRELPNPLFKQALATGGFNSGGLYPSVVTDGAPILCARCHLSEALPNSGMNDIKPLTQVIHTLHAKVTDPLTNLPLGASDNRTACYRCHPGSETQCLRGAMGKAVAQDGSMLMQCQSCHGSLNQVGAANRTGWLDEPTCQACHTGTAIHNSGEIRYTSVFTAPGQTRQAANTTFATNDNAPSPGFSLYRFSKGHGGLYCSACHGSTHAEFPSLEENDNLYSINLQGHAGPLAECQACHGFTPATSSGGPHGMHSIGQVWVAMHGENDGGEALATANTIQQAVQGQTPSAGSTASAGSDKSQCLKCHNTVPSSPPPHALPSATGSQPAQPVASATASANPGQSSTITSSQCSTCHGTTPSSSPPHPIPMTINRPAPATASGNLTLNTQNSTLTGGTSNCQACHGLDYRGTVLSRALTDRTLNSRFFPRGHQFGCYDCHNGPGGG